MAEALNPYRAWLGVVSDALPPTHYELLGIAPAQADAEHVAEAFRRQMSRLNPHLAGEHAAIAQKLAAQLADARVVLLTPTTRRAYDAELAAGKCPSAGAVKQRPQAQPSAMSAGALADALLPPSAGPMAPAVPEPQATLMTPPMNQPLPPAGVAPAYPAMPAGYVHPQAYGQPYAPAYPAAAAPQAVPVYSYGQPYPAAAQPFPGQQAYQAQPVAAYPTGPAMAVVAAPAAPQLEPGIASLPSTPSSPLARNAERKRSSPVPMLAGMAVAGVVIVGGVIFFVKSESQPQPVADNSSVAVAADAQRSEPKPPIREVVAGANATKQPSGDVGPRRDRLFDPPKDASEAKPGKSQEKLFTDDPETMAPRPSDNPEEMTAAPTSGGKSDKAEMSEDGMPKGETPEAMEKEAKPETPKAEAEKSATSPTASSEKPAPPEPPAEDKKAIEKALNAARKALVERDLAEAEIQLAQATLEATSPESLAQVDRVQMLAQRVSEFWNAVREMLPKLEAAETFEVEGEQVSVVEASSEMIIVRVAGKNREYQLANMPAKLADALAKRWLEKDSPVSLVVLGAFQAVDPKGDRQEARLLFEQAQAGGMKVDPLLEELDSLEDPSEK